MIPRRLLLSIPALLAAHNLEEAVTVPRFLPVLRAEAPALEAWTGAGTAGVFLWALALATLVPLAVVAWAAARPDARWAQWGAALVQAVVALNVLSHLGAAAALRGYTPGLATALLVNLPFSVYFFRRAARERWMPRGALWSMLPAAVVVHGPGLLGLFWVARAMASVTRGG